MRRTLQRSGFPTTQIALLLASLLGLPTWSAAGQSAEFVWAVGADGDARGTGVAADHSGNIYAAGYFASTNASFDGIILTNRGINSLFIAKYDAIGKPLWVRQSLGSKNSSVLARAICADREGNAYVTGSFADEITLGTTSIGGRNARGLFLAKIGTDGDFQWVRQVSTSGAVGFGIAVDAMGNVGVTGEFRGTAVFGSVNLTSTDSDTLGGRPDSFVAKYDSNGKVEWARASGNDDSDTGYGIAFDDSGNVYVTGEAGLPASFFGVGSKMFVAKYDSVGNLLWERQLGTGDSRGLGVAVDRFGNALVTGSGHFPDFTLSNRSENLVVGSYSSSGDLRWMRKIDGYGGYGGQNIAVDADGNYYVTGLFRGSASFGATTLSSSPEVNELFVAAWDGTGKNLWAVQSKSVGESSNFTVGLGINSDSLGKVSVTGYFAHDVTFGSTKLVGNVPGELAGERFFLTRVRSTPPGLATPQLRIFQSSDSVILSWPVSAAGSVLEFTEDLSPSTAWERVTVPPVVVGDEYAASFPTSDRRSFFRLRLR